MRVSAKTDYALRALLEMSSRTDGKPVSAEELGRLQDIPHGFLQAILADLRKAGVVIAQRGQSGGWRMNRDPGEVSVADVIRAVDGPLVSVYGVRPESVSYNEKAEVLQLVWIAARSSLRDVFENVSLADLASATLPEAVTSRTADEDAWQPPLTALAPGGACSTCSLAGAQWAECAEVVAWTCTPDRWRGRRSSWAARRRGRLS